MSSSSAFTSYLLSKYAKDFEVATTNPFLQQSGKGTIDESILCKWLRQDYLYAFVGYIKFASLLLSRIPISTTRSDSIALTNPRTKALTKAIPLLTFSLSNVVRETDFFVSTAQEYGLDAGFDSDELEGSEGNLLGPYEEITRSYVDFLGAVAGSGSFEEGLVVLWAMEKAYYTAWSYAKTYLPASPLESPSPKQQALLKFIDNWTNVEFKGFVDDCQEVVDGLGIEPESEIGKRCEGAFKRCLYLEQRFWPAV